MTSTTKGDRAEPGRFSVEGWLVHSVQRRLTGTSYGVSPGHDMPDPVVFEDPLVNQVLKMDVATFLIAERHSVSNTARMIALAPSEDERLFLATQVADEARHFEAFPSVCAESAPPRPSGNG